MVAIKKIINRLSFLLLILACILESCQKFEALEASTSEQKTALSVSTRSTSNLLIPFPVRIYAFSENGTCVEKLTVTSSDEKVKMNLATGIYQLVALAGLTNEYTLPDHPELSNALSINDGKASEAVMMGRATISLSEKSTSLEILLSHSVAAFKASFSGLSTNTSGISIHLSPIYGSLRMSGEYIEGGKSVEISCYKEEEDVWSCDPIYIFPGSGQQMAFSITIEEENGETKTYGYQTSVIPEANHPYIIHGVYQEGTIQVEGGLIVEGWGEAIYVDFDFGPNASNKEEEVQSGIPEIGSIWNDCIVVKASNETETSVDLLLMSIDEWEIYRVNIGDCLEGYRVNNLDNWRVPTYDEAGWLNQNIRGGMVNKINDNISARQKKEYLLNEDERYLCDKDGVIYSYTFMEGKNRSTTGDSRTYLFRAVKKYTLTLP
ncbi:MAG: FimB/Mfa2 family fimbrial subunit [Phocaeicola sp.]